MKIILSFLFVYIVNARFAPCLQHRQSRRKLGVYHPQCTIDGAYEAKQCHGSTGYCWCVDHNGHKIQKAVPPGTPLQCY